MNDIFGFMRYLYQNRNIYWKDYLKEKKQRVLIRQSSDILKREESKVFEETGMHLGEYDKKTFLGKVNANKTPFDKVVDDI